MKRLGLVRLIAVVALLVGVLVPGQGSGQVDPTAVFAVSASNSNISLVDFDAGTVVDLNTDANQLTSLRSAVALDRGDFLLLVVADTLGDQILTYVNGAGNGTVIADAGDGIFLPSGLSANRGGDLYLVAGTTAGGSEAKQDKVWKIPKSGAGFGAPVLIDGSPTVDGIPVEGLADTRVSAFTATTDFASGKRLQAGDLLVCAENVILRYPGGDPIGAGEPDVFVPSSRLLAVGAQVTGCAFATNGDLLVVFLGGSIHRFGPDGSDQGEFTGGLGTGKFDLEVGFKEGASAPVPVVLVASRNNGFVARFLESDGSSDGEVSAGLEFPADVATPAAALIAPTLAGSNIAFQISILNALFETVDTAGATSGVPFLCLDDRGVDPGCTEDSDACPADGELKLSDCGAVPADSDDDAVIPPYLRGFKLNGQRIILLVEVETTAGLGGTVQLTMEEADFGFATSCGAPFYLQPRSCFIPDADDPTTWESANRGGGLLATSEVSVGCGSNSTSWRNERAGNFSWFCGMHDVRSIAEIIADKLLILQGVLTETDPDQGGLAGFIERKVLRRLQRDVAAAIRWHDRGRDDRAQAQLEGALALVEGTPGAFSTSQRNVPGELEARLRSLLFFLCGCNDFLM